METTYPNKNEVISLKICSQYCTKQTRLLEKFAQIQDDLCNLYREEHETSFYAFMGCSYARDVWDLYLVEGWPTSISKMEQWWT